MKVNTEINKMDSQNAFSVSLVCEKELNLVIPNNKT